MKRLLAFLAVLCLTCGAALAEELWWSDVAGEVESSNLKGKFRAFQEVAVKMWVPEALKPAKLEDSQREHGLIGSFHSEKMNASVIVTYNDLYGAGMEDLKAEALANADCTEVTELTVNNMPALRYRLLTGDKLVLEFVTLAGYEMKFSMGPISGEAPELMWKAVCASIQPE